MTINESHENALYMSMIQLYKNERDHDRQWVSDKPQNWAIRM